ncbi:MAG: hypothetical protein FJ207_02825 [Gemmatimonadetes bacterium]|nr:hypothetical protein [Gemmatimonadota bacterium]
MQNSGVYLSESDLRNLTRAAEILHDPLGFSSLDGWRAAVNSSMREIVRADVAIFYVRSPDEPDSQCGAVCSDDLSADQVSDFIRHGLFDAGSDRALAYGLSVATQRGLVGEDWDTCFADSAVNAFYLPNHLRDAVGILVWDREGRKEASIEMHRTDFGTPLFGEEGVARLTLLLPGLRAGVAAVRAASASSRGVEALLDSLDQPVALADSRGRLTFRSSSLAALLDSDPEGTRVWAELGQLASSQAAMFEARGWGRRHRTTLPSLEGALSATSECATALGRYLLSVVEAPGTLTGGRHGFLLRAELMFPPVTSAAAVAARFGLTAREVQVARLLASGAANERIAFVLTISPHTARRHTEKVLAKLGVTSRAAVGPALRGEVPSS